MRDPARSVRQRDDDAERSKMEGEVSVSRAQLFVRCSKILETCKDMQLKQGFCRFQEVEFKVSEDLFSDHYECNLLKSPVISDAPDVKTK